MIFSKSVLLSVALAVVSAASKGQSADPASASSGNLVAQNVNSPALEVPPMDSKKMGAPAVDIKAEASMKTGDASYPPISDPTKKVWHVPSTATLEKKGVTTPYLPFWTRAKKDGLLCAQGYQLAAWRVLGNRPTCYLTQNVAQTKLIPDTSAKESLKTFKEPGSTRKFNADLDTPWLKGGPVLIPKALKPIAGQCPGGYILQSPSSSTTPENTDITPSKIEPKENPGKQMVPTEPKDTTAKSIGTASSETAQVKAPAPAAADAEIRSPEKKLAGGKLTKRQGLILDTSKSDYRPPGRNGDAPTMGVKSDFRPGAVVNTDAPKKDERWSSAISTVMDNKAQGDTKDAPASMKAPETSKAESAASDDKMCALTDPLAALKFFYPKGPKNNMPAVKLSPPSSAKEVNMEVAAVKMNTTPMKDTKTPKIVPKPEGEVKGPAAPSKGPMSTGPSKGMNPPIKDEASAASGGLA